MKTIKNKAITKKLLEPVQYLGMLSDVLEFFCQTRQFFAGRLVVCQEKLTQYGEKRRAQMTVCKILNRFLAAICAGAFSLTLLTTGGMAEASVYSGGRDTKAVIKTEKAVKRESDDARARVRRDEAERERQRRAEIERERQRRVEAERERQRKKEPAAAARKSEKNSRPTHPKSTKWGGTAAPAKPTAKITAKETAPFFPAAKVNALVQTAKELIGTKYVYGGTTPNGFDCSGFLQHIFKMNGSKIPRTADAQYDIGRSVAKTSLLVKGDLVFFAEGREISHCGLYLGGGKFIHASSSSGVRIDAMNDSYWKQRYVGAKHVIK